MPRAQKVQAAPQEQYGDRQALKQAQQAQPLPQVDPMAVAQAMAPPENLMQQPFDPNEPVTAGMPYGPGPNTVTPGQYQKLRHADILALAAARSNNPVLQAVAAKSASRKYQSTTPATGGTVRRNV